MKAILVTTVAAVSLSLGVGIGIAAKLTGAGIYILSGKSDREAGLAALSEAERLAGKGSSELIAIGRVYYLSGDKVRSAALFDRARGGKQSAGDYQLIAEVYAEAGDTAKAEENYGKMLVLDPEDDSQLAEVGAWYIRIGQRAKGEQYLAKAFQKGPHDPLHYVRAAEGLLGVPLGR
jgi:tetratricopeptide (TPR) repeat protein